MNGNPLHWRQQKTRSRKQSKQQTQQKTRNTLVNELKGLPRTRKSMSSRWSIFPRRGFREVWNSEISWVLRNMSSYFLQFLKGEHCSCWKRSGWAENLMLPTKLRMLSVLAFLSKTPEFLNAENFLYKPCRFSISKLKILQTKLGELLPWSFKIS